MHIKTETWVGLFIVSALFIFLFMSFKIGIWRVDTVKYAHYIAYFSDVSGLNEKSDVVISGVKVGWVQKLSLSAKQQYVRVDLMIDRSSIIYANAYGVIKQNGLLGTKYIELMPGDLNYPLLPPGSTLMQPSKPSVSIDSLLSTFKEIADNVNSVTSSLKQIVSSDEHARGLHKVVDEAQKAFTAIQEMAHNVSGILSNNDVALKEIMQDVSSTTAQLKHSLPQSFQSFSDATKSIAGSIEKMEQSFNSTMDPIKRIATDVNAGNGLVGTLFKDGKMSQEIKATVNSIKEYFSYVDRLGIDLDIHSETMHGRGNDLDFKDSKGYFNFLIRPADDFYYVAGITSSYAGVIKRYRVDRKWYGQDKHEFAPAYMNLDDWQKLWFSPVKEKYERDYSAVTFNIQFAKEFGRINCRAGLFESTFGFGLDYDIPLWDDYKWITSFEIYRFNEFMPQTLNGRLVFDIDLPHLKWYNKVYYNDNIYFVFGADDFVSKFNKNFFAGIGMAFEQNDIKYLAPSVKFS